MVICPEGEHDWKEWSKTPAGTYLWGRGCRNCKLIQMEERKPLRNKVADWLLRHGLRIRL